MSVHHDVQLLLQRCTQRGTDPVRALDERGYLLHPAKQRRLQADTLRQAADLLHLSTVKQLQGGHTTLDTKNAVEKWLREQADQLEAAHG